MGFFQTLGSLAGSVIPGTQGWGTAIGSGLGSLIDDQMKEDTASWNDREVREWQEAMYNKQFANNTQFWREQQEYNTPKNQVKRLQEAGINPAFALGNIQSGQMGSVGSSSVPSGSVSQRVTPHRLNSTLEGLLSAQYNQLGQKETVKSLELDNKQKEIDIETQAIRNVISLWQMLTQGDKNISGAKKDYNDIQISNFLAQPQAFEMFAKALDSLTHSELNTIDTVTKWEELRYLPRDKQIEYSSKIAEIDERYARKELTEQQVKTEIEKTNGEFFRNENQKFVNSLNQKTEDYIIEKAKKESYGNAYQGTQAGLDYVRDSVSDFFDNNIMKPSKRLWKDTKRYTGLNSIFK